MNDAEDRLGKKACFSDRILPGFKGITLAYGLTPNEQEYEILHYAYSFELMVRPSYQTRAFRQYRRMRGEKNKPLPRHSLRDELIVVPGPGMAPEDVVLALEKMIRAIRRDGLIIGKSEDDKYLTERMRMSEWPIARYLLRHRFFVSARTSTRMCPDLSGL